MPGPPPNCDQYVVPDEHPTARIINDKTSSFLIFKPAYSKLCTLPEIIDYL